MCQDCNAAGRTLNLHTLWFGLVVLLPSLARCPASVASSLEHICIHHNLYTYISSQGVTRRKVQRPSTAKDGRNPTTGRAAKVNQTAVNCHLSQIKLWQLYYLTTIS